MPKFLVQIARLSRQTKTIVVEAPTKKFLEDRLSDVYDLYSDVDDDDNWFDDWEWGTEQGTHHVYDKADESSVPDIVLEPE
jgi:hypothetical protein